MSKQTASYDSVTYAFIDAQNVYKGVQSCGWMLDWRKFRVFLSDKYYVNKAIIFLGYMSQYQDLYSILQEAGFIIVFKPVITHSSGEVKGNVDADLIVECWKREEEYTQAILVTGDGDFTPLVKLLREKGLFKSVIAPNRKYSSSLLRKAAGSQIMFIEELRAKIERKQGKK